ncbi:TIGR00730 family Rossman fold protein [Quadrisphaera sp. DSM 44207]|uniref:LOG family protein n=1 Tax=Quadrisphaera sp. DSM 44207 TaxID=1881057 RepID=UPI00087E00C3|nr:TIGR00730 family Rossman fold protein [Quadrisphaera sp. DSM 44207]SDQ71343.1 hypothetical protein SAMN05428996_2507 [Quadrisphaera sp. DSM 44207]
MAAVAVFCSASERIDPEHLALAARVGALLAERGHSLVSGGGSLSMMGALARAVRAAGGRTYGVIPAELLRLEVGDTGSDELVVTDGMRERKGLMDAAADAFLVLPGGLGTLEELLEVWSARALRLHAKPVVVCDPTGVLAPLRLAVEHLVDARFVAPAAAAQVRWSDDPRAAVALLEAELAGAAAGRGAGQGAGGVPPADRLQEGLEAQP